MEDIKLKVFESANVFKGRFESSQESNELNNSLKVLERERTGYILELGETTYTSHRRGEKIQLEGTEQIIEIDKKIHQLLEKIELLKEQLVGNKCECGNELLPGDSFCKECGKEISEALEIDEEDLINCLNCGTRNHIDNNYCISCGNKLE